MSIWAGLWFWNTRPELVWAWLGLDLLGSSCFGLDPGIYISRPQLYFMCACLPVHLGTQISGVPFAIRKMCKIIACPLLWPSGGLQNRVVYPSKSKRNSRRNFGVSPTPPYNQTRPSRYIWGCVLCTCKALSSMYYKYTTCSQLPQLYRYTTCSQNPSESKLRHLDVSRMPVTSHDEAQQRRTTTHNDDCTRRPAKRDDEAR